MNVPFPAVRETTKTYLELTAVIEALKKLKEPCVVELYSDSKSMSLTPREKGLGMGLEEAGLDQIRQKACTERRPLGKRPAFAPDSSGPLSLGHGTQHQFPQQPLRPNGSGNPKSTKD